MAANTWSRSALVGDDDRDQAATVLVEQSRWARGGEWSERVGQRLVVGASTVVDAQPQWGRALRAPPREVDVQEAFPARKGDVPAEVALSGAAGEALGRGIAQRGQALDRFVEQVSRPPRRCPLSPPRNSVVNGWKRLLSSWSHRPRSWSSSARARRCSAGGVRCRARSPRRSGQRVTATVVVLVRAERPIPVVGQAESLAGAASMEFGPYRGDPPRRDEEQQQCRFVEG